MSREKALLWSSPRWPPGSERGGRRAGRGRVNLDDRGVGSEFYVALKCGPSRAQARLVRFGWGLLLVGPPLNGGLQSTVQPGGWRQDNLVSMSS